MSDKLPQVDLPVVDSSLRDAGISTDEFRELL